MRVQLLFCVSLALGALHPARASEADTAAGGTYPGRIVAQQAWADVSGRNIVYIKETGVVSGADGLRNAFLHAWQLRWVDGRWQQIWHVQDFVRDCPLDLGVTYSKSSLQLTDLDADGIREVSFVYTLLPCVGDVSPANMKLILQASQRKYAIRGTTVIVLPDGDGEGGTSRLGGDMKMDAAFDAAAPAFKRHALALWKQFQKQLKVNY